MNLYFIQFIGSNVKEFHIESESKEQALITVFSNREINIPFSRIDISKVCTVD